MLFYVDGDDEALGDLPNATPYRGEVRKSYTVAICPNGMEVPAARVYQRTDGTLFLQRGAGWPMVGYTRPVCPPAPRVGAGAPQQQASAGGSPSLWWLLLFGIPLLAMKKGRR